MAFSTLEPKSVLEEILDRWKSVDIKDIIRGQRNPNLLQYSNDLASIENKLSRIVSQYDYIPTSFTNEFVDQQVPFLEQLILISGLSNEDYSKNLPARKRDVERWMNDISHRYEIINLFIETAVLRHSNKIFIDSARQDAQIIAGLKTTLEKEIQAIEKDSKPLLRSLQISNYNDNFSAISKVNNKEAETWMYTLVLLILVFLSTLYFFIHSGFEYDNITENVYSKTELLQKGLGKSLYYLEMSKAIFYRLLFITLFTFLIKLCYSNYRAAKHNATSNLHKANSMKAALGLINRAIEEKIKDQILQMAANAVFAHQPTGYNDKDVENLALGEKVVEKVLDHLPKGN